MTLKYQSIISIVRGDLILKNVNFKNIVVTPGHAVIKTFPWACGYGNYYNSFIYDGGEVSLINNGFEVIHENPLASFISICGFKEIIIKNVKFTMNVFSGPASRLMKFWNFFRLELNNIKVDFQVASKYLIEIDQRAFLSALSFRIPFLKSDHVIIANSEFSYIVATRLISIVSQTACMNIRLENNKFTNIDVNSSVIWNSYSEYLPNCIESEYFTNYAGQYFESAAKNFLIVKNEFSYIFASENMINLLNIGRFSISESTFTGIKQQSLDIFDTILSKFSKNNLYTSLNTLPLNQNCQSLLYTSNGAWVNMTLLKFHNNHCVLANIYQSRFKFIFNDSEILKSRLDDDSSLIKFHFLNSDKNSDFIKPSNCIFENLSFSDTILTFKSRAIIEILEQLYEKISFSNLKFTKCDKAIKTQNVRNLEIKNIEILNSTSNTTSGIDHNPYSKSHFMLEKASIENSGQLLSVSSSYATKLVLELSDCQILNNTSQNLIYISNMIEFVNSSYLTNNKFENNKGLVLDFVGSGDIIIEFNEFLYNENIKTSILNAGFRLNLLIRNNKFMFNSGSELISSVILSNPGKIESFDNDFEYNIGSCFSVSDIMFNDSYSVFKHNINSLGTIIYAYNLAIAEFKYSSFINNTATSHGNFIISLNSYLHLFNISALENKANGKGGVIFADENSRFELVDSFLESNIGYQGSCIFAHYSHNTSLIKNTDFIKNKATYSGCISIVESKLIITNSLFKSNTGVYTSNFHISVESFIQMNSVTIDNSNSKGTNMILEGRSKSTITSSQLRNINQTKTIGIFAIYDSELLIKQSTLQESSSLLSIFCTNS